MDERTQALIDAATRLLEAREDQMVTGEEWDTLREAVVSFSEPPATERDETFRVDPDGCLVRVVVPRRGEPYEHRCPRDGFEAVAYAAERDGTFVLEDLRREAGVPWTQAAVAFAFLKERGVVLPAGGRAHAAASPDAHLDAMIEYQALRDKGPSPV